MSHFFKVTSIERVDTIFTRRGRSSGMSVHDDHVVFVSSQ